VPYFRGVFEAMIISPKKAIKAILEDANFSDDELHTAMCGAEPFWNSRRTTYVSSDPDDLSLLAQGHLRVGEMGGSFAPEVLDQEEVLNTKKTWHRVQQLLEKFWKRFPTRDNLKEGDVVLISESKATRGEWPMAPWSRD